MDEKQRYAAGMKVRREILGGAYVDRAVTETTDLTSEFQDLITRYAWGEIWPRPGFDEHTRCSPLSAGTCDKSCFRT